MFPFHFVLSSHRRRLSDMPFQPGDVLLAHAVEEGPLSCEILKTVVERLKNPPQINRIEGDQIVGVASAND
jgi:hypothetical protein